MPREIIEIRTVDQFQLQGSLWTNKRAHSILAWIHSSGEHHMRYEAFAKWLLKKGIALAAIDLRGHGLSQGQSGHIHHFEDYLEDMHSLLRYLATKQRVKRLFVGAHSFGALVLSRYLEARTPPMKIEAAIMLSPLMGSGNPIPHWKQIMLANCNSILPGLRLKHKLDSSQISSDPEAVQDYQSDPLIHHKGTLRKYNETRKNQKLALARLSEINIACLVLIGNQDDFISKADARTLYEGLKYKKKKWIAFPGMRHDLLHEKHKIKVYKTIHEFLKRLY